MNPTENKWKELGVVSDETTGMAAIVTILEGTRPLPGVQLGHLIGPEKTFSPYVHPKVTWADGKGSVSATNAGLSIPPSLSQKIADLLKPHLIEGPTAAIRDLQNFDLLEVDHGGAVESALGCLKCS